MADMRLVVTGAAGRMGRMLIKTIHETPGAVLAGALEREGSNALGEDAGLLAGCDKAGVAISIDPLAAILTADGILDFSSPAASVEFAALAAQARVAYVVGTTGLSAEDLKRIAAAARHAPIVRSGNMSLGVNLLAALTRRVAQALGEDFDIEIVEMHHRMKVDAPSGTALMLGEAAARGAKGVDLSEHARRASAQGHTGARRIGVISALRAAARRLGSGRPYASFSLARANASNSRIAPRTAPSLRAARSRPRFGRMAARPACIRWPTCWVSSEG